VHCYKFGEIGGGIVGVWRRYGEGEGQEGGMCKKKEGEDRQRRCGVEIEIMEGQGVRLRVLFA
jgi:hypothetical protein